MLHAQIDIKSCSSAHTSEVLSGHVLSWTQSVERFDDQFFQVPAVILAATDGVHVVTLKRQFCDIEVKLTPSSQVYQKC